MEPRPHETALIAIRPHANERTTVSDNARWLSASIGRAAYETRISTRTHTLVADEPRDVGGTDTGPTPYELLLGALASCTAMTLRMYADRKQWPVEEIVVRLRAVRSHAADCVACETEDIDVGQLEREVEVVGTLTEEQRARLLYIADRCPVKQTLERGLRIQPYQSSDRAGTL